MPILFADCKYYSHEGKSACQPKRLAHNLWKICRVQILFARRQKCVSAPKAGARSLEDLPTANIVRTKAKVRVSPKG